MPLATHQQLLSLIESYAGQFSDETSTIKTFTDFVIRNAEKSVYARTNFDGHITASAFLLNADRTHILLLKHKKLGKWLQPGGHIDDIDDSIYAAALREVGEETGLQPTDLAIVKGENLPFDLDAHTIPENPKKDEPAHVHYDVRFLFTVENDDNLQLNEAEADGLKWILLEDFFEIGEFERLKSKFNLLEKPH